MAKSKNNKMSQQTFNKLQDIYNNYDLKQNYANQFEDYMMDGVPLQSKELELLAKNPNISDYDLWKFLGPSDFYLKNELKNQNAALDSYLAAKSKNPNASRYFTGINYIAPDGIDDGLNMFEPDSTVHWSSGPFEPNLPNNIYTTATSGGGNSTVPPPKGPGGIKGFFSKAWDKTKGVGKNTLNYVKAHPGMSVVLGIGGAANIGGLFDNNKIGGQILGATGAGLGAHFIPKLLGKTPLGIPAQVAIGLGGGTVGALFDKLRAKREQEQQAAQQYYGN